MHDLPAVHTLTPPLAPEHLVFFGEHFDGQRFHVSWPGQALHGVGALLKWQLAKNPQAEQKRAAPVIPVQRAPRERLEGTRGELVVTWLGHASFLVQLDGVRVVIDPLFGGASAAVKRATPAPLLPEELGAVDVVLLTHGHRDHFDVASLKALGVLNPSALWVTPLGLSRLLPRACVRRMELDWWQHFTLRGVRMLHTPSQHWHQRGLRDRNRALWGGWHLQASHSLYHTGDSGYFAGFEAMRELLGAPDVALIPAGAYAPRWFMQPQHMDPAESLRAWEDVGARWAIPMHWGTFDLSDEPLNEGPRELRRLLGEQGEQGEQARLARLLDVATGGSVGFERGEVSDLVTE